MLLKRSIFTITENITFLNQANVQQDYGYFLQTFLKDQPPRIFFHEIVAPNLIEIRFNEAVIFKAELENNIKVSDKETHQVFTVERIEFLNSDHFLHIYVKDLPSQPEKFYLVELNNFYNALRLSPHSYKITVVYRPKYFKKI